MSLLLGLTGGIGSGKTAASNYFAELGIDIIDADIIARDIVAKGTPALKKIIEHFGQDIIQTDGELDRTKMRHIIFSNPEKKIWLENLTHPLIREEIEAQIAYSSSSYTLLVAPLLFEGGLYQRVDKIIVVDCTVEQQLERASARDSSKREKILAIIKQQIPREERLNKADFVLNNQHSIEQLQQQIDQLHKDLIALAQTIS